MTNKEKIKVAKFKKAIKDCIEWLKPKMVNITNEEGKVVGKKDVNIENVFIDQFFVDVGFYRQIREDIFITHPYLRDEYNQVKELQELKISHLGLFKKTSESLTKFMLTNLHKENWQEKVVNENTHEMRDFSLDDLVGFKDKTDKDE